MRHRSHLQEHNLDTWQGREREAHCLSAAPWEPPWTRLPTPAPTCSRASLASCTWARRNAQSPLARPVAPDPRRTRAGPRQLPRGAGLHPEWEPRSPRGPQSGGELWPPRAGSGAWRPAREDWRPAREDWRPEHGTRRARGPACDPARIGVLTTVPRRWQHWRVVVVAAQHRGRRRPAV